MTAPTCAKHSATRTAAAESAVARWLAAHPDARAESATLPDGRVYMAVRPFDAALSLRIDAIVKAMDDVRAWPDSAAKRECMAVLSSRLRQLEAQVTA